MPVTPKDLLLNHLEYTFEKEAWQPSLAMAVRGLTAEQAAWKPGRERHSIWQIVRHVLRWKHATFEAWDGTHPLFLGKPTTYALDLERTDWQEASGDDGVWHADVKALDELSRRIKERIQMMDADAVQRAFPGEEMPAVLRVLRMATHDAYHAGQIRYIRALQGPDRDLRRVGRG
jgi:uncharacterized damage-inducible protein DinB